MTDYFKEIFKGEENFKKNFRNVVIVFTKIWDHNKIKIEKILLEYDLFKYNNIYYFTNDGSIVNDFKKI